MKLKKYALLLLLLFASACLLLSCGEQTPKDPSPSDNTYRITYELDGGTNDPENPLTYSEDSETITLKNPTRIGYEFVGWSWENHEKPTLTATIPAGSTGNLTFVANWTTYFTFSSETVINGLSDSGKTLTTLVIPYGITEIANSAFRYNSKLQTVILPEGFVRIGSSAFYGCNALTTVTVPDSVTEINPYAFTGCASLSSITLPASLSIVSNHLFDGCRALKNIRIPDGVERICENAFYNCTSLTSVTIPDSVTSVEKGAFANCQKLASVTLGDGVKTIGEDAFAGCSSLSTVNFGTGLTSCKGFSQYNPIKTVIISDLASFAAIDYPVPNGNPLYTAGKLIVDGEEITDLVIPDGVKKIGSGAFAGLTSLKSVTLPASVESVGNFAFSYCSALERFVMEKPIRDLSADVFLSSATDLFQSYDNALYLGDEENPYALLIHAADASITSCEIHPDTEIICKKAFYNCTQLTGITVPDSVERIDEEAFYSCTSLAALTLPASLTSLGARAFAECYALPSVVLPSSLTEIGAETFAQCRNLTSATIDGLTFLSDSMFKACDILDLVIPDSVEQIGAHAFEKNRNLKNLTIPDSVKKIEDSAFQDCSALETVMIGSGLSKLGSYAFYGCGAIRRVEIPDLAAWCSVVLGTNRATPFSGDTVLTSHGVEISHLVIPAGVESIGRYAFSACYRLTAVTIPDSVKTIGEYAFGSDRSLCRVTLGRGLTMVSNSAFAGCNFLFEVVNHSDYALTCGSTECGGVAANAKQIFKTADTPTRFTYTDDGFIFYQDGDTLYLVTFMKITNELVLPTLNTPYDIYPMAFSGLNKLTKVTVPGCVRTIGENAFANTSLYTLTLSEGLIKIGNAAFKNSRLSTLRVPDSVRYIGDEAFYECGSLGQLNLGSGVIYIGKYCFNHTKDGLLIYYKRTKADWANIEKHYSEVEYNPNGSLVITDFFIICSDGPYGRVPARY